MSIKKKKQKELERKEADRIKKAEAFTSDMCYYGLFQSLNQLNEGLERLDKESEKRKALESQIKFRKNVLHQKHADKKVLNLNSRAESGKYTQLPLDTLKKVLTLIQATLNVQTHEKEHEGLPLLVGKRIEHKFTDGVCKGYVISLVPGFPQWYNVKYEGDPAVYAYNLSDDNKKGDLKIVVSAE